MPTTPALAKMQRAIQLSGFHYIACLKARPSNADGELRMEGAHFSFAAISAASSRDLHIEFQAWAAVTVLRDLVEAFSIFLMEAYREAVSSSSRRTFAVTAEQFERRGIEDQLSILSTSFAIDPIWTSRLTGYNRARNCLAHRAGLVDQRDATDDDELVVRWLAPSAELTAGEPTPHVAVEGPFASLVRGEHVSGGAARIALEDREKRALIGTKLSFKPDEILEICSTFQLASAAFDTITTQR
jgi:hypothetical protein